MIVGDEELSKLYDECWEVVKHDPGYENFVKPKIYCHADWIPDYALAGYCGTNHSVSFGAKFWEYYGDEDLDNQAIQEIRDIIYHEFAHIVHYDHEPAFWEQTHLHDSTGAKIREFYRANEEKFNKKLQDALNHADECFTEKELREKFEAKLRAARGLNEGVTNNGDC